MFNSHGGKISPIDKVQNHNLKKIKLFKILSMIS